MRRQDSALVVDQGEFGILDLAGAESAPELTDALDDAEQPACRASMRVGQHASVRVDGQLAADRRPAIREKSAALTRLAESQLF